MDEKKTTEKFAHVQGRVWLTYFDSSYWQITNRIKLLLFLFKRKALWNAVSVTGIIEVNFSMFFIKTQTKFKCKQMLLICKLKYLPKKMAHLICVTTVSFHRRSSPRGFDRINQSICGSRVMLRDHTRGTWTSKLPLTRFLSSLLNKTKVFK